jgi:hypothetical protein
MTQGSGDGDEMRPDLLKLKRRRLGRKARDDGDHLPRSQRVTTRSDRSALGKAIVLTAATYGMRCRADVET